MANKVHFGLQNVYYAKLTEGDGGVTFAAPVAIPGAVSMELNAEGDTYTKYADNRAYFVKAVNNGYSGTFECTLLPDSFKQDILGELVDDSNGLKYEVSDAAGAPFALLFQVEGDEYATKFVLYKCTASRPSVSSSTTEDSMEVQDETLEFVATPLVYNGLNLVKGYADHGDSCYDSWTTAVTLPL